MPQGVGLVLSRRAGERIRLLEEGVPDEDAIWLTVTEIRPGGQVKLGIDAPGHVRIDREELLR